MGIALVVANYSSAKDCREIKYSSCVTSPAHWYVECPSGYVYKTYRSCGGGLGFGRCKLECVREWEQSCSDCTKPCPTPRPTEEPTSNPHATPTLAPTKFPSVAPMVAPSDSPLLSTPLLSSPLLSSPLLSSP